MPEISYLTVPIGDLRKNPWNSNQVSAENEEKIRESIRRNGIFKPVIVRQVPSVKGYEIIGGEHRWEQAKELKHTSIPIVDLGEIDDKRAKEVGVIDNARYGVDDAISLGELLNEIGAEDIQSFLPYGEIDLQAIFSANDIALDDLDIDESFDKSEPENEEPEAPSERQPKTHTVMRFKVSIRDSEALTGMIAKTQREQGLTLEDDLTNAGDALIHILTKNAPSTPVQTLEEIEDELEEVLET
jgi:hypothetical protein